MLSFLKVNDASKEDPKDKLTKIRFLIEYIRKKNL